MADDASESDFSIDLTTSVLKENDEAFNKRQTPKYKDNREMDFNLADLNTFSVKTLQEKLRCFYHDNFNLRHEIFLLNESVKISSTYKEFQLARQIQILQESNKEKYQEIEESKQLLKTLMETVEEKEEKLRALMIRNKKLTEENDGLKKTDVDISLEMKVQSLESRNRDLEEALYSDRKELENLKLGEIRVFLQVENLSKINDELTQNIAELKSKLNDKEVMESEKNSEIADLRNECDRLQEKLNLSNVYVEENDNLKTLVQSLKTALNLRDETITDLQLKIAQAEDEINKKNELIKNDTFSMGNNDNVIQKNTSESQLIELTNGTIARFNSSKLLPVIDFNKLLLQKDDERNRALEIAGKLIEYFEDFAMFFNRLLHKKDFSQLLNSAEYSSLKSFIEQSLDISRRLYTSFSMSVNVDDNFSGIAEQIVEDYNAVDNVLVAGGDNNDEVVEKKSIVIENLREQIEKLKIEIELRDYSFKNTTLGDKLNDKVISNVNTAVATNARVIENSESETWSEPDRQVSSERMGIVDEYFKKFSAKIPKIKYRHSWNNEILSSSTDDDHMVQKNQYQKTILMLKEEISGLNRKFNEKICEIDELKILNKQYEEDKKRLESILNKTRKEFEEKCSSDQDFNIEQFEELASRVDNVQKLKHKLEQKNEDLKKALLDMEFNYVNDVTNLRTTIVELQKDLDSATMAASQASIERTNILSEKMQLETEVRTLSERLAMTEENLQDERRDHQRQLINYDQEKIRLEIRISELEYSIATLKNNMCANAFENSRRSIGLSPMKSDTEVLINSKPKNVGRSSKDRNESSDYFSEDNRISDQKQTSSGEESIHLNKNDSVKSLEALSNENADLKRQVQQCKQTLLSTLRELELSNQRRKGFETAICSQMKKASKVMKSAKQNIKALSKNNPDSHS